MIEHLKKNCRSLLEECSLNIPPPQKQLPPQHQRSNQSALRQQQIEKRNQIIDKLRKKSKVVSKYNQIRKTQLGQDSQTFTAEQYDKLHFLDQCLYRGFLPSVVEEATWVDCQILSSDTTAQILRSNEWAALDRHKAKEARVLFVKHPHKDIHTHPQRPSAQPHAQQTHTHASTAQLDHTIATLKHHLQTKLQKETMHCIYMSDKRKEALFQARLMTQVKKRIPKYQYDRIIFSLEDANQGRKIQTLLQAGIKEKENQNFEAKEVLQKHMKWIAKEKKRVIKKINC